MIITRSSDLCRPALLRPSSAGGSLQCYGNAVDHRLGDRGHDRARHRRGGELLQADGTGHHQCGLTTLRASPLFGNVYGRKARERGGLGAIAKWMTTKAALPFQRGRPPSCKVARGDGLRRSAHSRHSAVRFGPALKPCGGPSEGPESSDADVRPQIHHRKVANS